MDGQTNEVQAPVLLTVDEAAAWCHITRNTLNHLRFHGRFAPAIKIGKRCFLASGGPAGVAGAAEGMRAASVKTPYGTWRVQVKYRSVVVADRTFQRKGDAVRWEIGAEAAPACRGSSSRHRPGRSRCASWPRSTARISRQGQVSVRAWESDESALRVHIVPAFGKFPISSVGHPCRSSDS